MANYDWWVVDMQNNDKFPGTLGNVGRWLTSEHLFSGTESWMDSVMHLRKTQSAC